MPDRADKRRRAGKMDYHVVYNPKRRVKAQTFRHFPYFYVLDLQFMVRNAPERTMGNESVCRYIPFSFYLHYAILGVFGIDLCIVSLVRHINGVDYGFLFYRRKHFLDELLYSRFRIINPGRRKLGLRAIKIGKQFI